MELGTYTYTQGVLPAPAKGGISIFARCPHGSTPTRDWCLPRFSQKLKEKWRGSCYLGPEPRAGTLFGICTALCGTAFDERGHQRCHKSTGGGFRVFCQVPSWLCPQEGLISFQNSTQKLREKWRWRARRCHMDFLVRSHAIDLGPPRAG